MAVWASALALAVAAVAMLLPATFQQINAPTSANAMIGFAVDDDAPWLTLGPPIGAEAARSGVHRGDRLIAIDGRPVAANKEALAPQLAGPIGARVRITTQSPAGKRAEHLLTRDPLHFRQALADVGLSPILYRSIRALPWCVGPILMLGCAIILMARRSRDPLAPWASLMMLAMILGTGKTGPLLSGLFPHPALVDYIANSLAASLLMIVLVVFPDGRFEPRWSLAVAVLITLITVADLPFNGYAMAALTMVAAVAVIAVRYRAMPAGNGRQQIRWTLLGFAAAVAATAAVAAFQIAASKAEDFGLSAWMMLGAGVLNALIFVFLMLGITVSLLRYRLYDADATISRTVAYSLLTVSLLAIFAGSEKVIEIMGEQYFGERIGALAGGLGAAVAAVMISPIHHRATRWAEHRFRSGLTHLRQGLPLLVGDLRETATPKTLADAMLARVEGGVRARHGAVVLGGAVLATRDIDPQAAAGWLIENTLADEGAHDLIPDRADPLFPMRVPLSADGAGLVGWLLLGPRPDGSFYGREERAVLREIADPIARALAIASERESRESARQHREEALFGSVDTLHKRINALRTFVLDRYGFDADAPPARAKPA